MSAIIRGIVVYCFLLVIFRIAGKRTLAEITTFDLVLTLIISESIQQGLIGLDNSLTNAFLTVIALVGTDITLAFLKQQFPALERVLEGMPVLLVQRGEMDHDAMQRERVSKEDLLHAARREQGVRSMSEIEYAVIERSGGISIVPKQPE